MQTGLIVLLMTVTAVPLAAAEETVVLDDERAKVSYALGMQAGAALRKYALDVDADVLMRGFTDALAGEPTLLTDAESRALVTQLQAKLRSGPTPAQVIPAANRSPHVPSSDSQNLGVAHLEISYKLDPRLTRGLYMGDRWVSLPTYVGVRGQEVVEARVSARDRHGKPLRVSPKWIASDPQMVTVTPGEGNEVQITVNRVGESRLQVVAQGITEELTIKAIRAGENLKLEIHHES
jgi:hypothetical protein